MHKAVRILLFVVGLILILPGLCGVVFAGVSILYLEWPNDILRLIIAGLLAGAVGVWLMVVAIKKK